MNKYTGLSDFEINKKVAEKLGLAYEVTRYGVVTRMSNKEQWREFNPCNNPADAMPIIKDSLISITHDGIAWDVSCAKYPELSVWNGLENYNDNFYRKAMELFLLMKDAENEG
ncbi:TPA: phage protein NinX family protein [Providencia stuartii]